MTSHTVGRLFGALVGWTAVTSIFAWLPLVRILGRPDGYHWRVLGLSGSGTDGPFWIFIVLTIYVGAMLWTLIRGPRWLSYTLVVPWHGCLSGVVAAGLVQGGSEATMQGQGLRWEIPLGLLAVAFLLGAGVAIAWVVGDRRTGSTPVAPPWSARNTFRLVLSLALLGVALLLFRAGTNYDMVTALAIVATVAHWIALIRAFGDLPSHSSGSP